MGLNANIHAFIKRAKNLRMLGSSAFCLLILLSLLSIFPIAHHEDQAEAAYVPSVSNITITSASNTASVDITPASNDGTFATSTAASEVAFNVTTNNLTGYNLSINGSDSTGNLTNPIASDTLETITSAIDANTFASGSTSTYTNKWGIKPNKLNGTNNTDYLPAPTTTNTITIDNTTASNTEANSYTIGLGARVDYTKPNGTYTNTFTLIAVGNPINYQINYLDNTGTGGTTGSDVANLPAAEGNSNVTASSFTLSSTSPTRSGYVFAGWCYGTVDHSVGSSTCSGTTYKPGDQFTFTSLSSGPAVANLYAMWSVLIQNLDLNLCVAGTQTGVVDIRDGNSYTVTKLPDGNCWMTKNLDLAGGTTLTPADSNVSANYTLPASETISSGTELANSSAFSDDNTAYVFNSNSTTCGENSPCYSYYSYVAATAGTGASISSGDAPSDICPKGWRLPTQAEYNTLISTYTTGAALTAAPFIGVYAGYYLYGSFYNGGSRGYYWSPTSRDTTAYYLYFNSSDAGVDYATKRNGRSVRCVAKTMQEFTPADAANMATGDTKTLIDARDGNNYSVAKLPDGNVWMTKNLDLAGGTTITPADSNVSANYTLPASETITSGTSLPRTAFSDMATAYVFNSGSTNCSSSSPCYSYYSFVAATAGTGGTSFTTGNAPSDICPKGWRLPTQAEYTTLKNTYTTGATLTAAPFNGVYAGYYDYGSFNDGGSSGYYWSSTTNDALRAYALYFDSSSAYVYYSYKRYGSSIRCVLDTRTISNITTMQSVNSAIANNTPDGATATLTDSRDSKTYTVAKIGGKIWMTKNLDLAGGTTLTPEKSNVSANYTLPASSTSGFDSDTTANVYNSGSTTCSSSSPCYSYYNYVAATAGTNPETGDATSDICPKGWRLPTQAELTTLKNTYTTGATLTAAPFVGVYAGYYSNGTFSNGGSYGYYWSSTIYAASNAYNINFYSSSAYVRANTKRRGHSVRCIAIS